MEIEPRADQVDGREGEGRGEHADWPREGHKVRSGGSGTEGELCLAAPDRWQGRHGGNRA